MIDKTQVVNSLLALDASPSSKEAGATLVDAWIDAFAESDAQHTILAVEVPWYLWLDKLTLVVGVMDLIAADKDGIFGSEWKSAKEPKKNKDGTDSAWWNEEKWLGELSTGSQVATYAMAMRYGTFVLPEPVPILRAPGKDVEMSSVLKYLVDNPRIRVRAAVKSNPVRFWPTDPTKGVYQFPNAMLDIVESAYLSEAAAIRARRTIGKVPYALTGIHCTNKFGRVCEYFEPFCRDHNHPTGPTRDVFDKDDPAYQALVHAGIDALQVDPRVVIFSASQYSNALECHEKYRINVGGYAPAGEESEALSTGTVMHAGLADMYRQIQEQQTTKGELAT